MIRPRKLPSLMSWVRGIVPQAVAEAGTSKIPYLWTPERVKQASAAPRGLLHGLTLSNNGADATNDIDIAVGVAVDDGYAFTMTLGSAITKQLDVNWVVGTNQGGLDTGAIANGTYHVFLIRRTDTGVVDVLFSTSATAPTMPSNYTQKRRIGSIIRAAAAIVLFTQDGDLFQRTTPVTDVSAGNPGASAVTRTLSVPTGINVEALITIGINSATAGLSHVYVLVTDLAIADTAPSVAFSDVGGGDDGGTALMNMGGNKRVRTNTSAQVRHRLGSSDASLTAYISTFGWVDTRGRNA